VSILAVFLDASYLIAFYNESDVHHQKAVEIARKIDNNEYGLSIISDGIFDEVISVVLRKFGKEKAKLFAKNIVNSIFIVYGDKNIFTKALSIFNNSKDNFSFTDCTSQAIIEIAKIQYIATFDKLFEKLKINVIN